MDSRYSTPLPPPGGQATAFISANDQIKAATASLEYPQLSDKTQEELEDLLNEAALFEEFFDSLPQVQSLNNNQSQLWTENATIASRSRARQDELNALRNEVSSHHAEMRTLQTEWEVLEKEQVDVLKRFQPPFLLSRLRTSLHDDDQVSESLAGSFLDAKMDAADWIKQYRDLRKTYHVKAAVAERWEKGGVAGME